MSSVEYDEANLEKAAQIARLRRGSACCNFDPVAHCNYPFGVTATSFIGASGERNIIFKFIVSSEVGAIDHEDA